MRKSSDRGTKSEPKGTKSEPRGTKSEPKGSQRAPKVSEREPKVSPIQHIINIKDKVLKKARKRRLALNYPGPFWEPFSMKNR